MDCSRCHASHAEPVGDVCHPCRLQLAALARTHAEVVASDPNHARIAALEAEVERLRTDSDLNAAAHLDAIVDATHLRDLLFQERDAALVHAQAAEAALAVVGDATLNAFHACNDRRQHEAFAPPHSLTALVVCVQEEVGELAAAVLGVTGEKKRKAHLTNADVLDAVADAMTYLSLVASAVGCTDLEKLLGDTFNMVSERAGSAIRTALGSRALASPSAHTASPDPRDARIAALEAEVALLRDALSRAQAAEAALAVVVEQAAEVCIEEGNFEGRDWVDNIAEKIRALVSPNRQGGRTMTTPKPVSKERIVARCPHRESGGVRCEKTADHEGDCACPEALEAFKLARKP